MLPPLLLLAVLIASCVNASDVIPVAQDHVLFVTTSAMLWALGKMVTSLAPNAKASRFWCLFRRTLPWHPVIAGSALGFASPDLVPDSVGAGRVAAMLYFGAAGVAAAYGHDVFRTWVKYRGASVVMLGAFLFASACDGAGAVPPKISGACMRSFRPTLQAWESQFGRVPDACAYLDVEYAVQLVDASEMPCKEASPVGVVVGCTQPNARAIYLLEGRDDVSLVDTSVHEWVHALAACAAGDMDREHLRAGFWALYGAGSVEVQAQAAAVVGPCL